MKKVTQLEYQIMILERMGPNISSIERNKLRNLKEQKKIMAEQGIELKGTVVPRFPRGSFDIRAGFRSECVTNSVEEALRGGNEENEDAEEEAQVANSKTEEKKNSSGQGVSSSYVMFLQVEREKLMVKDPGAKLDLDDLQKSWKNMGVEEKKVYSDMVRKKMEDVGENFRKDIKEKSLSKKEKKARKKVADKEYRERKNKILQVKKKEEDTMKAKLEEIVVGKSGRAAEMSKYVNNLKSEILKTQKMKKEVVERVVVKDVEIMVLKEQFKALHKIHKGCAKDDP